MSAPSWRKAVIEEQQRQSGWGDEAISFIEWMYSNIWRLLRRGSCTDPRGSSQ
ncbi:hypothetical protein [Chitinophaga barathri]|uniref:hypothetical protein n=1 Tax=Chitinophaga barathri TaxID=1647451 RepID=UPI0013C524B8|nr:hypothetical protein [Chitinophaga barathri]